jgi:hypothetical protein
MDWTGAGNNPEFFGTILNTLKIYGSLTLAPVMKLDLFGPVSFEAVSAGKTITSLGQYLITVQLCLMVLEVAGH